MKINVLTDVIEKREIATERIIKKYQVIELKIGIEYEEVRCITCGWLLAKKVIFLEGIIEIRCHKCKTVNRLSFK